MCGQFSLKTCIRMAARERCLLVSRCLCLGNGCLQPKRPRRSEKVSGQTQPLGTVALAFLPRGSTRSCQALAATEGTSFDVKGICTTRPPPAAASARPTELSYFAPMTPSDTTRCSEVSRSWASLTCKLKGLGPTPHRLEDPFADGKSPSYIRICLRCRIAALSLAVAMTSLSTSTPTVSSGCGLTLSCRCLRSSSRSVAPSGYRASSAERTVLPRAESLRPNGHISTTSMSNANTLTFTAGMASNRAAIRGVRTRKESAVEADVST